MSKGYIAFYKCKTQRGTYKNKEYSLLNSNLIFGYYGIKLLKKGFLGVDELIPLKRFLMKEFKGIAKVWARFLPQIVITRKPGEMRMGKGKGKVDSWIAPVKAGAIVFEFSRCILTRKLKSVLKIVMEKLSIKSKLITIAK